MMRRNKSIICWLAVIIIIVGVGVFVSKNISYNKFSNEYLTTKEDGDRSIAEHTNDVQTKSEKSFDFSRFNGKWSLIEINSDKNNKITINDNTKITKGKFYIVVLDPNYKIVGKIEPKNKKTEISFITSQKGKYVIRIVGKDSSGNFDVKISSTNDINIKHNDIFE